MRLQPAQCAADERRVIRNRNFFDTEISLTVLQHHVKETDHRRTDQLAGHAHAADERRRHHAVGASVTQTLH